MTNLKRSEGRSWVSAIIVILIASGAAFFYFQPHENRSAIASSTFTIQVPDSSTELLAKDCAAGANHVPSLNKLKAQINEIITQASVENPSLLVAVLVEDLHSRQKIGINDDEVFNFGSLIKIPILISGLKTIEQQPQLTKANFKFEEEKLPPIEHWDLPFFHPDPNRLMQEGQLYTFDEIFYKMIALSSNQAYSVMLSISLEQLKILNRTLNIPADYSDIPKGSVSSMAGYLRLLYDGSYLSDADSRKALFLMTESDFNQGLQAGLPPSIRLAHKFGVKELNPSDRTLNECAIVYNSDSPYLLCVFTNGNNFLFQRGVLEKVSRTVFSNFHY